MVSKIEFISMYVHVYDRILQRDSGTMKFNPDVAKFFKHNNVLKWEIVQAYNIGGSCIDPIIMVEYVS